MHIPEKYRSRYDALALSHPWMREMRDETETIGDLIEKHIAKSAKRAAAVERLRGMTLNTGSAIKNLANVLGVKWNPDNPPLSMAMLQNALIDLLTDDDALQVPSTSPNGTANGTANRTCPNGNGTASINSEAQSTTEPKLTEQSESLSDEPDSREKLECEVRIIAGINEDDEKGRKLFEDMIINLLDRQASITRREVLCQPDERDEQIAELAARVDSLTAERDKLCGTVDTAQKLVEKFKADNTEHIRRNDELQHELGYYVTAYRRAARERDGLARDLADAMDRGLA